MRHADLRREATAVIAKPASALCMILCCVVPGVGVWACGCVGMCVCGGGMIDAMGLKKRVKVFRLSFRLADPVEKVQPKKLKFSTGFPSRKTQSKKIESKKAPFRLCKKARFGPQSKKAVFD